MKTPVGILGPRWTPHRRLDEAVNTSAPGCPATAELVWPGKNAIYGPACAPVVVRVAHLGRSAPPVERELCVASRVAAAEVPVVRVAKEMITGAP